MSPYDEDWLRADYDPTAGREVLPDDEPPDEYDDPVAAAVAEMRALDDPREGLARELRKLAYDLDPYADVTPASEPWPPTDEWTRGLRAVLAEVEGAQRGARGDDPPDSGKSLGLEVRGGR